MDMEKGIQAMMLILVVGTLAIIAMLAMDAIKSYNETGYFGIKRVDITKCRELGVKNYE